MVTAASIAVLIALCFGLRFLRSLILVLGVIVSIGFLLMLLFSGALNDIAAGLACCLFIVFFWIYAQVIDEREQREREEQNNSQSNLA